MARYYFHHIGASTWQVCEPEDFPTEEAAAAYGRQVAHDMAANRRPSEIRRSGVLRVTDQHGVEILALKLSEVTPRKLY
jgi:catechol-2,3-dioxygenase